MTVTGLTLTGFPFRGHRERQSGDWVYVLEELEASRLRFRLTSPVLVIIPPVIVS